MKICGLKRNVVHIRVLNLICLVLTPFVGYTLSYMKKNMTITKVTKELGSAALNYIITGLTATTVYTIEVFAKTRMGPGPPRSADIESGVPPGQS